MMPSGSGGLGRCASKVSDPGRGDMSTIRMGGSKYMVSWSECILHLNKRLAASRHEASETYWFANLSLPQQHLA